MRSSIVNIKTIHILGWITYLTLFIIAFSSVSSFDLAFYRAVQMGAVHILLFYFNSHILMPRFLEKNKYFPYIFSLAILVFFVVGINYLLNFHIKPFGDLIPEGRGFRPNVNSDLKSHIGNRRQGVSFIFFKSMMRTFPSVMAILLLSILYRMFTQKKLKEKQEITFKNEHLLSEMKFLKSQVNPHFLFNSLNNIYALVYLKSERAPTMLMKLSEMLRYMLYECNDEWVPLAKEIAYIENYIELQQLKTEHPQNIIANFGKIETDKLIPPLLLIPFVENSFKHSRIEDTKNGWISMHLTSTDNGIQFIIVNSIPSKPIAKDEVGGIGLKNVKRRLELLYPNNYELTINKTGGEYSVVLNLNK